jgi:hypothetical protein
MGFFATNTMTLQHENGTVVAQHLPVTLDPVNLDWAMQVQGLTPIDVYACETVGWSSPVPLRSDYLVDETDGTKYSMYSTVFKGINSLQFQVTRYSGTTP